MAVFLDDRDYRYFVHTLGDVVEEFGLTCWNYCLMPNHYHATVEPSLPNFSEAIRRLNARYGQWWNRRHGRVGHVFQGRFKDQIVSYQEYLLALSRYVVMNPVRASIVARPEQWPWSSYRATAGLALVPSFLSACSTLALFGSAEQSVLQQRFAASVIQQPDDPGLIDRIRSNELILGPKDFKDAVRSGLLSPFARNPSPSVGRPDAPPEAPAAESRVREQPQESS